MVGKHPSWLDFHERRSHLLLIGIRELYRSEDPQSLARANNARRGFTSTESDCANSTDARRRLPPWPPAGLDLWPLVVFVLSFAKFD